jgi:hypothetical protein
MRLIKPYREILENLLYRSKSAETVAIRTLVKVVKKQYPDLADELINQVENMGNFKTGITFSQFEKVAAPEKIKYNDLRKLFDKGLYK